MPLVLSSQDEGPVASVLGAEGSRVYGLRGVGYQCDPWHPLLFGRKPLMIPWTYRTRWRSWVGF
jgi:hypothetical protein